MQLTQKIDPFHAKRIFAKLCKFGKTELDRGTSGDAGVLQNVVKVDLVHAVLSRVDGLQVVLKGGLEHHGGGVASLGGRGVVRAGVAALSVDVGDLRVLEKQAVVSKSHVVESLSMATRGLLARFGEEAGRVV